MAVLEIHAEELTYQSGVTDKQLWLRRVDFHTQAADTHNKLNSEDAERLLKAVYDIMAPKGMPPC